LIRFNFNLIVVIRTIFINVTTVTVKECFSF